MAQSNHHRLDSPADELQRPSRRHSGAEGHPRLDPSASPRPSFSAIRLPVSAEDEPSPVGVRLCVGQTSS
jgi:hypothetical protein